MAEPLHHLYPRSYSRLPVLASNYLKCKEHSSIQDMDTVGPSATVPGILRTAAQAAANTVEALYNRLYLPATLFASLQR